MGLTIAGGGLLAVGTGFSIWGFASGGWGVVFAAIIGLPCVAVGTALVVPGSVLLSTAGPHVDFAPERPMPVADGGPRPVTAVWTVRF